MEKDKTIQIIRSLQTKMNDDIREHCIRVAEYTKKMCESIEIDYQLAYNAALVHDIGKVFYNTDILNKKGKLRPTEKTIIDYHAYFGWLVLKNIGFNDDLCTIVLLHHGVNSGKEYWPKDLRISEKISMLARIVETADIWDALTADRPYRKSLSNDKAKIIMLSEKKCPKELVRTICEVAGDDTTAK